MAGTGMDMMMRAVVDRVMSNLPPEVLGQIGQIGHVVAGFQSQLDVLAQQIAELRQQNTVIVELLSHIAHQKGAENVKAEGYDGIRQSADSGGSDDGIVSTGRGPS